MNKKYVLPRVQIRELFDPFKRSIIVEQVTLQLWFVKQITLQLLKIAISVLFVEKTDSDLSNITALRVVV